MHKENELAAIFLCEVASDQDGQPVESPYVLEQAIVQAWDKGHQAWPAVMLEPRIFASRLAQGTASQPPSSKSLVERIAQLPAADLYLACACACAGSSSSARS